MNNTNKISLKMSERSVLLLNSVPRTVTKLTRIKIVSKSGKSEKLDSSHFKNIFRQLKFEIIQYFIQYLCFANCFILQTYERTDALLLIIFNRHNI